jgi:hypothetical protein
MINRLLFGKTEMFGWIMVGDFVLGFGLRKESILNPGVWDLIMGTLVMRRFLGRYSPFIVGVWFLMRWVEGIGWCSWAGLEKGSYQKGLWGRLGHKKSQVWRFTRF